MHPRTRTTLVLVAVPAHLLLAAGLFAGPLNPPAGPVATSYKTMTEVQPRTAINAVNTPGNSTSEYVISQPGSYYLTGNITTSKVTAINVASNSVTIDLGGFVVATTSPSSFMIINAAGAAALNVHDGRLTGTNGVSGKGVNCLADQAILRRLSITCDGQAIAAGINPIIEDVAISGNNSGTVSIGCGDGAQIRRVAINGAGGISVNNAALIQDTVVRGVRSAGITTLSGSTITGCTVYQNTGQGILTTDRCTVSGCTATLNTNGGIYTGPGCTITGCSAGNNTNSGISANSGSTITGCTAGNNTGDGIDAIDGSTISNCNLYVNNLYDITVINRCIVLGNMCAGSSPAAGTGIYVSGAGNRVEGNNFSNHFVGVYVQYAGNVIIKNTCLGNTTNWNVAAGNVCFAVVGASSGFTGNSGGAASGTTDPNANFSY